MVYSGESMLSYLKKFFLLRFKRKKQPAMQNSPVDKDIFHFFGSRIWVSMPVNQYEFPCGYVTGH